MSSVREPVNAVDSLMNYISFFEQEQAANARVLFREVPTFRSSDA